MFFLDVFSIFLFVFTYSSKDSCGNKSETASKAKSAATEIALLDKKTPLATLILEIRKEKAMEIEKGKKEEDQNQKRQRQGQDNVWWNEKREWKQWRSHQWYGWSSSGYYSAHSDRSCRLTGEEYRSYMNDGLNWAKLVAAGVRENVYRVQVFFS